jgi:U3 small nucleolar ribonucleoprotein protein LCP5
MSETQSEVAKGLQEALQRTEASLLPAIEEHLSGEQFEASQGLDFLDVKNSLLLSYLIELTNDLRNRLLGVETEDRAKSMERLHVMKTVIDKSRGLDKKLRYQIDKLMAAGSTASTYAAGPEGGDGVEDPLQFRPDLDAMDDEAPINGVGGQNASGAPEDDDDSDAGKDDDDELAAARMTVTMSRETKKGKKKNQSAETSGDGDEDTGVYRAPRLTSVPYTNDKEDVAAERESRQRRRMRASELAQTLRAQYGDAPEQEDIHGGSDLGRQREAARRMAEREKEKAHFEEDNMVRLTTSRKEKKEKLRLMREENSNLGAISDLGNLVRESQFGEKRKSAEPSEDVFETGRHANGKRKKQQFDRDGKLESAGRGRKSVEAKNSLQAALFGGKGSKDGKKKSNNNNNKKRRS